MRLALINNFFPPRASGSSHLTEGLARLLAADGVEVLVVTAAFEDTRGDERRDGYDVVRLPSWSVPKSRLTMQFDVNFAFSRRSYRRLTTTLDDFRPDLIHQHGQFFDLTFMSSVYAARRHVPTVLSVHTRLEHTSGLHDRVLTLGDRTVVRHFVDRSRPDVVVMDRLMHDYVVDRYRIPEDRLAPIPVGVEPTRFTGDGTRVREYVSLAGTLNNCAGGRSPWSTWLTCEESESTISGIKHGWVFEVDPYDQDANRDPKPLKFLGRFAHESVAVDPVRSAPDPRDGLLVAPVRSTPGRLDRVLLRRVLHPPRHPAPAPDLRPAAPARSPGRCGSHPEQHAAGMSDGAEGAESPVGIAHGCKGCAGKRVDSTTHSAL